MTRRSLPTILALTIVTLVLASAAEAQAPSYQTKPRSGGGKAARFGGAPTGGKRTSSPGMNGASPPSAGAMFQSPQRGAARPSVGALAPSAPIKGGATAGGSTPFVGNRAGGVQVFSPDQFKSGMNLNQGMIKPQQRGR